MGNGFQVEMKDVKSFPLFDLEQKKVARFDKELISAEKDCKVFKRNAGKDIPNINFNFRQDLLQEIDKFVLDSISMKPHQRFWLQNQLLHGDMSDLGLYTTRVSSHGGLDSINWLEELSKSENKSRNKTGKASQFSSIDGWTMTSYRITDRVEL